MAARRRILRYLILAVLALLPLLVATARLLRSQADRPATVPGGVLQVRNLFTYIYGARVGGQIVLFDAGVDETGGALDVLLGALGGDRDAVSHVFLSHGHFDHVAASPLCKRALIHVGAPDVEMLAHRVRHEPRVARWLSMIFAVPAIQANAPFQGRAEIPLSDGTLVRAIPFPGHTPGSYLILWNGVLFAGDSMQIDGDRLEFAMAASSVSMDDNRRSVARLGRELDGQKVEVVCTGHQGCTPPGRATAMLGELYARAR